MAHTKNFQPVLIKAYYHAGLKELAKRSGFRAETLQSLENCSHFKRTHSFLTQAWEALYYQMISTFTTSYPEFDSLKADLQASIASHESDDTSHDLLLNIQHLVAEVSALDKFLKFVEAQ